MIEYVLDNLLELIGLALLLSLNVTVIVIALRVRVMPRNAEKWAQKIAQALGTRLQSARAPEAQNDAEKALAKLARLRQIAAAAKKLQAEKAADQQG
jgi:hypothetical protein